MNSKKSMAWLALGSPNRPLPIVGHRQKKPVSTALLGPFTAKLTVLPLLTRFSCTVRPRAHTSDCHETH